MNASRNGASKGRRLLSAVIATAAVPSLAEAAIESNQQIIYKQGIGQDASTNEIKASDNFSQCTCDITPNGCDHACCCDPSCDAGAVARWRLMPGYCLDELFDSTIIQVDDCYDRLQQPALEDLQGGISIYMNQVRALTCTSSKSEQSVTNYFIEKRFEVETSEEFDTLRDEQIQPTAQYTFLQPPVDDLIHKNTAAGYQPMEYIKGAKLLLDEADAVTSVYKDGDKVSFNQAGVFGHCELNTPALFMKNQSEDTCVVAYKPVSEEICQRVDFKRIANLKLQKGDGSTTEVTARPGKVLKFSLNDFKQISLTSEESDKVTLDSGFLTSTFTSDQSAGVGTCTCDNYLLEAHYKVEFQENPDVVNSFFITDLIVDMVYGQITRDCTSPNTFSLKTSVLYFNKGAEGRSYSGSPGYIRGYPILIGQTETESIVNESGSTTQLEKINFNLNGFSLRGATNNGKCYYVNQSIQDPLVKLDENFTDEATVEPLIETADEKTYFEDPVLTFEDSLTYGCSMDLNLAELQEFCSNDYYRHLMLFENLYLMEKVGISGRADQHYDQDWIDVTYSSADGQTQPINDDTCTFPSVAVVEIYYQRINTKREPQYVIMKMEHYSRSDIPWKFTLPDRNLRQTFQATVIVNSFIVDQEIELFVPSFEDIIDPLDRNVLYPFYVYGDQEDET